MRILNNIPIIISTCMSSVEKRLKLIKFKKVIIDEAA